MDVLGHVLLGAAVSGELTPYTVALSLLPDIGALPLQYRKAWKNPPRWMLQWYRLCHSPLMLFVAYFLPGPAFLIVSTHVIADMVTHDKPYSDFPLFQWDYKLWEYWAIIAILGVIACARLFF